MLADIYQSNLVLSTSTTGNDALIQCEQKNPDLILYEYDMPDLNGLAFFNRLSQNPAIQGTPIVMVIDPSIEEALARSEYTRSFDYILNDRLAKELLDRAISRAIQKKKMIEKLTTQRDLLELLSYHDALTGMPNRLFFERMLIKNLASAKRYNRLTGILLIDLDGFIQIDKKFGQQVADNILKEVATRFTKCIRINDTLAHLGSDDFGVALDEISHPEDALLIANRFLLALDTPIIIGNDHVYITASIGISCFPRDGSSESELTRNCQLALISAKNKGGNCIGTP